MNTLSCYIVDDEFSALSLLEKFIAKTPGLTLAGSSEDPVDALNRIICPEPPDITFLDVNMNGLSGLDVLARIRNYSSVVLTTAHPAYAVSAFDLQAVDFLLKPFDYDRFVQAVCRIRNQPAPGGAVAGQRDFFYIKTDAKGKLIRIVKSDIVYVRSVQNYVEIVLDKGKHLTYLTLREMEDALAGDNFLRIHKSFIINGDRVRMIENGNVILTNDLALPLGQVYRDRFHEQLGAWSVVSKRSV